VLTRKNSLNTDIIACLAEQICRLHDRGIKVIFLSYGPMGIRELTTTKFVAWGSGQIRI